MSDLIIALRKKRMEDGESNSSPVPIAPKVTETQSTEDRIKSMEEKLDKILECVYRLEGGDKPEEKSNAY